MKSSTTSFFHSFFLHIRPRCYSLETLDVQRTWLLGFFALFLLVVELITGIFLMVYYSPTPETAYESILHLHTGVPFGRLLRDIHRLAGELLLVASLLHLARIILKGTYGDRRRIIWCSGVSMLLLILGLAFSGYLLPWDQLAYWAVTVGTSMLDALPVAGHDINVLLRGGETIGADGLLRFYLLHVLGLPLLLFLLVGVHYYHIVKTAKKSNREESQKDGAEKGRQYLTTIRFWPTVFHREVMYVIWATLILLVIAQFFYDAPVEHHADPEHTPFVSQAPWFFLWVQGLLKFGDTLLMGLAVPALVFLGLFIFPCIDRSARSPGKDRSLATILVLLAGLGLVALSLTGTSEHGIAQSPVDRFMERYIPDEGAGLMEKIPYAALAPGIYGPSNQTTQEKPVLLQNFQQEIQRLSKDMGNPSLEATMVIDEWQENLKRITLRLKWQEKGQIQNRAGHLYVYNFTGR
ncbi:cytochrome b N-terminal domain-containing protein [Desulfogranum japonicum]|uniref:cytochrome b N-terminal domain-containing protein n=1 Tax=Desulfogranum japonicum TaxID=231447 RepID=UPI000419FD75|nr:cytochrome b N-terminal domain-containing protein [Desulfogranum japonicum]